MSRRKFIILLTGLLLLGAGPARALEPTPWQALSEEEKETLIQHRNQWGKYPPKRQQRLLEGTRRYQQLGPAEQHRMDRARRRFQELPPVERKRLRERYLRSRD